MLPTRARSSTTAAHLEHSTPARLLGGRSAQLSHSSAAALATLSGTRGQSPGSSRDVGKPRSSRAAEGHLPAASPTLSGGGAVPARPQRRRRVSLGCVRLALLGSVVLLAALRLAAPLLPRRAALRARSAGGEGGEVDVGASQKVYK